ncbi:LysE family transporter [Stappia sp. GBMRC 2046]|uniref:LysE family transporter n=1 Tax=Stappia sediminis TaxID=2692190 RepID=A0A7X3S7T7_9HYPH|nr:LysE family translocator [Stappia sediminis]MXN65131.1 LysE family transporter [Stappia sediminis]
MEYVTAYLPGILLALGATALGLMTPGPNILSVIGTSMSAGRAAGKALAYGIGFGACIWATLAWAGLAGLLTVYASAITALKIAGAAYLLWLAFKAFRSAANPKPLELLETTSTANRNAYFRRGFLVVMTNPKAVLVWIAIMSLGVSADSPWWVGGIIMAVGGSMSIIAHQLYAVAFSTGPMIRFYARARRWIEAGLGTFFCFASYKLLTSRT